jgi:hypothetical protein
MTTARLALNIGCLGYGTGGKFGRIEKAAWVDIMVSPCLQRIMALMKTEAQMGEVGITIVSWSPLHRRDDPQDSEAAATFKTKNPCGEERFQHYFFNATLTSGDVQPSIFRFSSNSRTSRSNTNQSLFCNHERALLPSNSGFFSSKVINS